jgi:hypothetical protein
MNLPESNRALEGGRSISPLVQDLIESLISSRTPWKHQRRTEIARRHIFERVLACLLVGPALDTG